MISAGKQFREIAQGAGLNMGKYDKCIKSEEVKAKVEADMKEAESIGVRSTPTFVINGVIVPGANVQAVKNAIETRLSDAG